jgi:hypothetical protein
VNEFRFIQALSIASASSPAKKEILSKFFPNRIDRKNGLFHGRTTTLLKNNQICYLDMISAPIKRTFSFEIIGHSLGATMLLEEDEWDRNKEVKKLLIHPRLAIENGKPDWPTRRAMSFGRSRELWILVEEGTEEEKVAWDLKINHAITQRSGGHYPSVEDLIESIMTLSEFKLKVRAGAPPVKSKRSKSSRKVTTRLSI